MEPIYLDNNATTPLLPAVWEAMQPFAIDNPGNPTSSHQFGRRARRAIEDAREQIASLLDASPDEVIFTSGATEANNLAIFGLAGSPPAHLVSSPIEHPCVIEPLRQLAAHGFALDLLPVDKSGVVQVDALTESLKPDTRLVSVMFANHETGAIQPLGGDEPRRSPAFHCDAAAAAGKIAVRFHELGVSALTISAHKFHGPKGIGVLLLKRGTKLQPLLWGGHQQQGRRPGTEPVSLAVGMAKALQLAVDEMAVRNERVCKLRRQFLEGLRATAAPVVLNGPEEGGVPHTLNLSFPGCQADVLLMKLDLEGVACSTGSACSSGSLLPSPVLQAMNVPDDVLRSAMRFSFSALLTEAQIDEAVRRIARVVEHLRSYR